MSSTTNLTVTGIDFGSSAVKIAAVLKGGVQIITNQANFRQTPNVVAMGQKERLIGQMGQLKVKSNHSNTVIGPSRYLGFDKPCSYLTQELKLCSAKTKKIQSANDHLKFSLLYGDKKEEFNTEQLVASFITEIEKIIAHTNGLQNKNMVIAVPTYFTQHQRMALLDAIQITKKKVNNEYTTQLINEEIAVSMDYGYSKRMEFSEELQNSKKVLFIDFGHSKTALFLTAFNKQHFRILTSQFNRQLGCKSMDLEVLNYYAQKFDSEHPNLDLNLMQSKKAVLKLTQNIQKQRKVLSGNSQHDLSIECILYDEDLHHSMKRKEYEEICQPVVLKFKKMLQTFYEELKLKGINIDAIELIGGGTRIPIILNAINEIFQLEPSRTLNSSQSVAKGAALISAMNSSIFRVQPYNYFTINPYNIQLKINGQIYCKNLIDKHELLLKEKIIQIEVNKQVDLFIFSAEYQQGNIEDGLENEIFECQVELKVNLKKKSQESLEMKDQSEDIRKLSIYISIDQNGLILLDKVSSQNCHVKLSKVNYRCKYSQAELSQMEQTQKQMTIRDLKIKKFYEKKNQYESIIYKKKHNIQKMLNENPEYLSESSIKDIRNFIENQELWLNSGLQNNEEFKLEDFSNKEKIMNQKLEQFQKSLHLLRQSHELVNNELLKLSNFINEIISKRTQDMYPQDVNQYGQWINQIFQKQKNTSKCYPPVVSLEEVRAVHQDLVKKMKQFEEQIQRQRMSSRRYKPNQQAYQQTDTFFRPSQQPYNFQHGGRPHGQHDDSYLRPRKGNRSGYNNTNPFGSFFGGSGFF